MAEDCCPGEPFRDDPNGMHTFDCPVYNAWADAWVERRRRENEAARTVRQPDPYALAYQAGYRRGLREGGQGRG